MKATDHFKTVIETYLKQQAEADENFKVKFENQKKNVDDCVTYILNEVQKSGCNGFADDEIFGMALHYYDEENVEIGKPINAKVVVNHIDESKNAKAYKINVEEIKFVKGKLQEEDVKPHMKDCYLHDLKLLKVNPKEYWDAFGLTNLEAERLMEIKYMQEFYAEKTPKPTDTPTPVKKAKHTPTKEEPREQLSLF